MLVAWLGSFCDLSTFIDADVGPGPFSTEGDTSSTGAEIAGPELFCTPFCASFTLADTDIIQGKIRVDIQTFGNGELYFNAHRTPTEELCYT